MTFWIAFFVGALVYFLFCSNNMVESQLWVSFPVLLEGWGGPGSLFGLKDLQILFPGFLKVLKKMISLFLGFASSAHLLRFHLTSSSEVSILSQSCLIWLFPLSILLLLWGFLLGGRFSLLVLMCKGSNLLQPHHILLHQDPPDEGTHLQIASSRIPSKFGWPFPGWSSVHTCRSGGFLYSGTSEAHLPSFCILQSRCVIHMTCAAVGVLQNPLPSFPTFSDFSL